MPARKAGREKRLFLWHVRTAVLIGAVALAGLAAQSATGLVAQTVVHISRPLISTTGAHPGEPVPPRVAQAHRFLARRGIRPGQRAASLARRRPLQPASRRGFAPLAGSSTTSAATWQPLGPTAVLTPNFGLVTGRVTSIALDPNDPTGNHAYIGATGGGVWVTANAAASNPALISFTPLTDSLGTLTNATDASISIGAVTVQPGGTGVILAGTGDPNDLLDSYYGAGIIRSADGGSTWTLIQKTQDREDGLSNMDYEFVGEGFAGFAWSTTNTQLVVAAISQAWEGTLVNSEYASLSYEGLYFSQDAGATWHLATVTDGSGQDVQGPLDIFDSPDGNAATAVVWNPVRQLFIAAVRYHGFYQSSDGVTWMRLADQPSAGIDTLFCPTNPGQTGSIDCPIFRAALAVNPVSGDTFAWSVDANNQDQGLWQDQCSISGSTCSNSTLIFAKQLNSAALETGTIEGAATILNGNYDLTLAAVPSQQDTVVLAGDNDLWMCSLAMGCQWRNTTNSTTCMNAQVAEFQHALAWNAANPEEILIGNDSGLWRSMDGIAESGAVCNGSDASHFQNLNGGLGSLSEVESMSAVGSSPYTMMAGLGVNGTAGVKGSSVVSDWPQILSGYGGPVAIDSTNPDNWYVNAGVGVEIYLCSQSAPCTSESFGTSPVVNDADVSGDGDGMSSPAPFLVDPLDATQLLIATCRLWRGPASGVGWSTSNAVTTILDSGQGAFPCAGDALVRSIAAMALPGGSEIVYLGMYGSANGGANLPGHLLSVQINPSSNTPAVVTDLTLSPVVNDINPLNYYGYNISSIFIDPHDTTGNTVYVTVAAFMSYSEAVRTVHRSTDGGAHWSDLVSNLPVVPVNGVVVDPNSANTVYLATDQGVFFTTSVTACEQSPSVCWSTFGSGLPPAPVVALSVSPVGSTTPVLAAATYGRGIFTANLAPPPPTTSTATASPASLTFSGTAVGASSAPLTLTIENTGTIALATTSITVAGDFTETDNCVNQSVAAGSSCAIQVEFIPSALGPSSGSLTLFANILGGQLQAWLEGTGTPSGTVTLSPNPLSFGSVEIGSSLELSATVSNTSSTSIPITSLTITGPFAIATNSCGATALAASADCQIQVSFNPTSAEQATGTLTMVDVSGTQSIELTGIGLNAPTDALSATTLSFPATQTGLVSSQQTVTLANSGGVPLTAISVSVSSGFNLSNNCTTQLAANSSCALQVQFAPTAAGAQSGVLTVSDILRTQTVALSGTGLAPGVIGLSPLSLTFANQQPGVASAPQTITVTNSGGATIANLDFAFTGAASAGYSLGTVTCGETLAAGASCTAQVIFTPSCVGSAASALNISSSTRGVQAVSVSLNGSSAISTGVTANPSTVAFGVAGIGQSSTAQAVTIANTTGYALSSLSLSVTGPFSLARNTCTATLAAGASCAASVVFSPTAAGPVAGALNIASAAMVSPITVALNGTGFNFTFAAIATSSQTVAAGQTANYTLAVTPSGAQEDFTFACSQLPEYASCSFNPAIEDLNSGVSGNVTVNISTSESAVSQVDSQVVSQTDPQVSPLQGTRIVPLLCGLFLFPFALSRRRRALLLAVLACVLLFAITACTSSGGGTCCGPPPVNQTTPPGTYTIQVTATANGMSQSTNLTLTVD